MGCCLRWGTGELAAAGIDVVGSLAAEESRELVASGHAKAHPAVSSQNPIASAKICSSSLVGPKPETRRPPMRRRSPTGNHPSSRRPLPEGDPMFTGIVEEIGTLEALTHLPGGEARLQLRGPLAVSDARLGDSIAV